MGGDWVGGIGLAPNSSHFGAKCRENLWSQDRTPPKMGPPGLPQVGGWVGGCWAPPSPKQPHSPPQPYADCSLAAPVWTAAGDPRWTLAPPKCEPPVGLDGAAAHPH